MYVDKKTKGPSFNSSKSEEQTEGKIQNLCLRLISLDQIRYVEVWY